MAASSSMKVAIDLSADLRRAVTELMKQDLLVGIPSDSAPRADGTKEVSNAVIGYVQEFGDEEKHIPARPFLVPGVEAAKPEIVAAFRKAGTEALRGGVDAIGDGLDKAGLAAQAAVRKQILNGSFAPLSERTLEARARRLTAAGKLSRSETSKAARREIANRALGALPSTDAKPLYDTHSLFNSITYVTRDKRDGDG